MMLNLPSIGLLVDIDYRIAFLTLNMQQGNKYQL